MPQRPAALLAQVRRLASTPLADAELLRRWADWRDEDAFTALVARHGRMVHGVCRRVLGSTHDAEDAFQAVFLVLARKAAALRHPGALPGWLHGVAVRLAYKARAAASRRQSADRGSSAIEQRDPHPDPLDALSARELLALIDQEIARLPEVYRLPVLLCDLEDRTQAEAAGLLGWTLGSVRGRLLRGRKRLRARLARRGISPGVLAAGILKGPADTAALAVSVSRLAVRFSAFPTSAEVPPSVAALVREGIRGMVRTKLKIVSAVLFVAGTLVAGAGRLAWPAPALPAEGRAENKAVSAPASEKPQVRSDQAGDPLPAEAVSRLGTTRFRHGGMIQSLAYSADGKTLVSSGWEGIRLWDAASGKEIQRFPELARAQGIALSPDGKLLATRVGNITDDKTIAIYEFPTGRLLSRFGNGFTPTRFLFSPDGKVLAAWVAHSPQGAIELWNTAHGRRLHTLEGHKDRVWSIAFSPDGKTLVSGSDDKTTRFWDVSTGKELRRIAHANGIVEIAFSPDGKLLASIDTTKLVDKSGNGGWLNDYRVRLWDAATDKELRQLSMPAIELAPKMTHGFQSLAFTPDGQRLLTGGIDGMLRIWDPATGKEVRHISGFSGSPTQFAFAPDGKTMAVVDGYESIRVLDFAGGKDVVPVRGHRGLIPSISVMPDGQTIATTSLDGTIRFWEAATGREWRRRAVTASYAPLPRLLPGGKNYLTFGADRTCRLCNLSDGEELAVLRGHEVRYPSALSPDGKTFAAATADQTVGLFDPATGAVRHTLTRVKDPDSVSGMSFTADGRTLVVWEVDGTFSVWDAASGRKRRQFTGPPEGVAQQPSGLHLPYTAALSPDGKLLAFGLQSIHRQPPVLAVLDTATGKEVRRFTTTTAVSQLTFSPDGRSLAWGAYHETTVYLGEIASGGERRRFTGHTGAIRSLVFSADGNILVSGSEDTTALVWDLSGGLPLGKKSGGGLSAEELESHWKTLADENAAAGYRAVQALAADPARSVLFLHKELCPAAPADEKRLRRWIADLDSDRFAVREKATSELEKPSAAALHAMRKALDGNSSLETRRRLEQLIDKQEREQWAPSGEGLRSQRALEVLERAGTPEAKAVLTALADGAPEAWLTLDARASLERLGQRPPAKR